MKLNWYHGTNHEIADWEIPPPRSTSEIEVPHTALFFTKNLDYARNAGNRVYVTSLKNVDRVVDMTKFSEASDAIRKLVIKNRLAAINPFYQTLSLWRDAWISGDALRMATKNSFDLALVEFYASKFKQQIIDGLLKRGQDAGLANEIVFNNLTRGLIEHICCSAKALGFSGIYGYEIDRFGLNATGKIEWLAIFDKEILRPPRLL